MIIPTAEPFFFPGGDIGCLLVHGFTGTPKEMRWMGEHLAKQGYSVLAPRLTGHATQPNDMVRARWWDWLDCIEDGWHLLDGASKHKVVAGLSMGGVLSLLFASRFLVKGVIAMSTPFELPPDPRLPIIRLLHPFLPSAPKGPSDWHDVEAESVHIDYPYYPTRSIIELQSLLKEMRNALPKVTAPVLLIHSRQDGGVDPENIEKIYQHLGSKDKQVLWVENSGHVITRDLEKEKVFQAASEFIHRVCKTAD
ncbi:MAG: alpha/beta fold hydrolase [Chloroflexota bacterium]